MLFTFVLFNFENTYEYAVMLNRTFSIEQTQNNFSKVVWFYDYWGKLTERKTLSKAITIAKLNNNNKVLDIGIGTGQLFEKVLKINKNGFNAGVDLSFSMLTRAKEKLSTNFTNYTLCNGNAFKLPYKNESFDYIFSSYVFDLLPENDFITVFSEFKRVMKTGGTGIVITMTMGEKWYNKLWYLLSKYFPSILTNCRPVDLTKYLEFSGMKIIEKQIISQNTFPSEIIKFNKK